MLTSLISIIIPNFNKESLVKETLLSIKAQTYQNFEAIIVDDASTDNSVQEIEKVIKDDARFKLIQQPVGKGGSAARNLGFSCAKGEYVIFFDSDDLISPHCLEHRVREFNVEPESQYDFVVSSMGCFKKQVGDDSRRWIPNAKADHLLQFLSHKMPWSVMQPMWRRSFLQRLMTNNNIGPFDEDYPRLQDVEMHTRALLSGAKYKIVEVCEPDCYYRIDISRTTASRENQLTRQMQGFCMYLKKIGSVIAPKPRKYRAALRLSYFEALVTLCYWRSQNEISSAFEKEKCRSLYDVAVASGLLSLYHRFIIRIYLSILRGRIKGVNWMTRRLIAAF